MKAENAPMRTVASSVSDANHCAFFKFLCFRRYFANTVMADHDLVGHRHNMAIRFFYY